MSLWTSIRNTVETVAPAAIGFAVGGPAGAAVGAGLGSAAQGGSVQQDLMAAGLGYAGGSLLEGTSAGDWLSSLGGGVGMGSSVAGDLGAVTADASGNLIDSYGNVVLDASGNPIAASSAEGANLLNGNFASTAGGSSSLFSRLGSGISSLFGGATSGLGNLFSTLSGAGSSSLLPGLLTTGTALYGFNTARDIAKMGVDAAAKADPFAPNRAQYAAPLADSMATPLSVDPRYATAASTANPVTGLAGLSVTQLMSLMANPGGELAKIPGYQAGIDAVQRSLGAQGYQGSGNMMEALSQYGGQAYQNQFTNLMNMAGMGGNAWNTDVSNLAGLSQAEIAAKQQNITNLSQLAGANVNPANAAQLALTAGLSGANLNMNAAGLLGKGITAAVA